MPVPGDQASPYHVSWPYVLIRKAELLEQIARRNGVTWESLVDLKTMHHRLQLDPTDWGDPLYSYPEAKLIVYRAFVNLLHVHYAVDDVRRIVYVKDLEASPGRALDPD